VEHALDSDIQQLCDRNPWLPDGITKKSILTHTPRLRTFLNEIPNDSVTVPKQGIELAVQVFGSLNAAVRSSYTIIDVMSSIPGFRTRRANLRRNISKYNCDVLEFMAHKTARRDIKNDITNEKKKLVRELQRDPEVRRTSQNTICRKLKALTGDSSTGFVDIAAAEEGSIYMPPSAFEAHRTAHRQLLNQQRDDVSYARETREETITRVFETLDFIPVTNFR
jgi:hypothetical protein